MIEVYERDMQYRNHSLIGPLEAPISLSFLDPGFQDNYGGEFVARGLGDGEGLPKHMKDIFFYTPDGEKYCSARVDSRPCDSACWVLDGRPVFLRVLTIGTHPGMKVNPRNGHMRTCRCVDCVKAPEV